MTLKKLNITALLVLGFVTIPISIAYGIAVYKGVRNGLNALAMIPPERLGIVDHRPDSTDRLSLALKLTQIEYALKLLPPDHRVRFMQNLCAIAINNGGDERAMIGAFYAMRRYFEKQKGIEFAEAVTTQN